MSVSAAIALTGLVFVLTAGLIGLVTDDRPRRRAVLARGLAWTLFALGMLLFLVAIWTEVLL